MLTRRQTVPRFKPNTRTLSLIRESCGCKPAVPCFQPKASSSGPSGSRCTLKFLEKLIDRRSGDAAGTYRVTDSGGGGSHCVPGSPDWIVAPYPGRKSECGVGRV